MRDTTPPAFPAPATEDFYYGLTKREYIATHLLAGLLSSFRDHRGYDSKEGRVALAFQYADLMIEETRKP